MLLTGTNTYTGGTTVTSGTLDFSTPNATPSEGIVTVNAGGYVVLGALLGASTPAADGQQGTTPERGRRGNRCDDLPGQRRAAMWQRAPWIRSVAWVRLPRLSAASVPEPSTFAPLGVAAIGLLGYLWRRKKRA